MEESSINELQEKVRVVRILCVITLIFPGYCFGCVPVCQWTLKQSLIEITWWLYLLIIYIIYKLIFYDRLINWFGLCFSALGAVAINRKLYVCGGYDGVSSLKTVEVYDPEKDV